MPDITEYHHAPTSILLDRFDSAFELFSLLIELLLCPFSLVFALSLRLLQRSSCQATARNAIIGRTGKSELHMNRARVDPKKIINNLNYCSHLAQ
jgi:hypothetical protein